MNDANLTTHEQDIRPSLGQILDGYQRLDYKVHNAIAEFVDNSTASYYLNKDKLKDFFGEDYILRIDINYNELEGTHGSLEIIDNAYGMDKNSFDNAVTISRRPVNQGGRNEYGMGLKTAASWFGKIWELKSQRPGTKNEISTKVNINELIENHENSISIIERDGIYNNFSTYLKITSLNRKITRNDLKKIKEELESIYRKDLLSKRIEIFVNGEKCKYSEPEYYIDKENENENIIYKLNFNEIVQFEDNIYPISGTIGILAKGKYANAGFTLFRRGRVIIGGNGKNYKPSKIFHSSNSFRSLRLYGEINLDTFPITQSKNNFDWDSYGLEDAFIDKMYEISKEYAKKCDNLRVSKNSKVDDKENIKQVAYDYFQPITKSTNTNISIYPDLESYKELTNLNETGYSIKITEPASGFHEISSTSGNSYTVEVLFYRDPYDVLYVFEDGNDLTNDSFKVKINLAFPLFNELNSDITFQKTLHNIIVTLALSEKISINRSTYKTPSGKALVEHQLFRYLFNENIKEVSINSFDVSQN
jgi:hypothetical protein